MAFSNARLLTLRLLVWASLLHDLLSSDDFATRLTDPVDITIAASSNAALEFTSPGAVSRAWLFGSPFTSLSPVNASAHTAVSEHSNSSSITFSSVSAATEGNYTAQALYSNGQSLLTCPARLSIAKISSTFLEQPSDTVVPAGGSAVLACSPPLSLPPAVVVWIGPQGQSITSATNNLYLYNVTSDMAGMYRCLATNIITSRIVMSRAANVTVTESDEATVPHILLSPVNTTAVEGSTVQFQCASSGGSMPTWSPTPPTATVLTPSGVLQLNSVTNSNEGLYQCHVGNGTASALLTVEAKPTPVMVPSSTSAAPGDVVVLSCTNAEPVATAWYSEGAVLKQEHSVLTSFFMFTVPLDSSGEVWVECLMSNSAGCSHQVAVISVQEDQKGSGESSSVPILSPTPSPVPTSSPITVTNYLTPPLAELSSLTVELMCIVIVDRPGGSLDQFTCDISWERNGVAIESTEPVLTVPSGGFCRSDLVATSAGQYSCNATVIASDGARATGTSSATVTNNSPPPSSTLSPSPSPSTLSSASPSPTPEIESILVLIQPPVDLTLLEGSTTNITCSAGGPPGTMLQWTQNSKPLDVPVKDYGNSVLVSVLQLGPVSRDQHGQYRCTASNQFTNQMSSRDIYITVIATSPSGAPRVLSTMWVESGDLVVQWLPPTPSDFKSHLLGYKLTWAPSTQPHSPSSALASVSYKVLNFSISGLQRSISYTVKVWAYSLGGDGPPVTGLSPSTPPPALPFLTCSTRSSTSALLSWNGTLPSTTTLDYACGKAGISGSAQLSTTANQHRLHGLLPNCSYNVEISSPSLLVLHCILATPPDTTGYIELTASWQNTTDLVFQWVLPRPLSGYADRAVVEVKAKKEEEWSAVMQGHRINMTLDPYMIHVLSLRVRIGNWTGYRETGFLIQPLPSPSPTLSSSTLPELWLTYGVGIVTLLVVCGVLLALIMTLKHVQSKRREKDKVTDHRRKARERSRRISYQDTSIRLSEKAKESMT